MPQLAISFAGGVDEATYSTLVDPSQRLTQQLNATQVNRQALGKTLGNTALTTGYVGGGGNISAGYTLATIGDALVQIDGHLINVYSETGGGWANVDRVPECAMQRYPLPLSGDLNTADILYCNGYIFAVAQIVNQSGTAYDIWACVVDAATMQPFAVTRIASGLGSNLVQLAASTTRVWAAYGSGSNSIDIKVFNTSAPASLWTSSVQITDWDGASDWGIDGGLDSSTEVAVIAYKNNSGGANSLTLRTVSNTPALILSATKAAPTTTSGVNLRIDSNNVCWVTYDDYAGGVGMRMIATDIHLSTQYTVATIITAGSMASASTKRMLQNRTSTTGLLIVNDSSGMIAHPWTVSAGAIAQTGSNQRWYNLFAAGRPWTVDSREYVEAYYSSSSSNVTGPSHMVVDFTDWLLAGQTRSARPVAFIDKGLGSPSTQGKYAAISATKYGVLNVTQKNSVTYGLSIAILDFGSSARWNPVSFGGLTYFAGAVTSGFDGFVVRELGYLARPSKPTFTTTGTGISLSNGARYVWVLEVVDSQGNIEWSAASDPSSSTGAVTNKTINVTGHSLAATWKQKIDGQRDVRHALYRTDDNNGIGPYYRVGYVANSLTSATVAIADTMASATLVTQSQLYINPGTVGTSLNREAPPASIHLFAHQDRIVALAEDGRTVFYSAPQVIGEAPWFNSGMQIVIPGSSRAVAGWSQDGRMVLAKESELYVVDGDGPPENGGNGTEFSIPRRVPSDVGCIEPRSIVTTTIGTFFRSRRGIEILNRGFAVDWIGEVIKGTLASYPVVTSASLDAENSRVIFTLAAAETNQQVSGGGAIAVYDLNNQCWFTRDEDATGWQSGCMSTVSGKPRFHWMSPSGAVHRERASTDGSAYLDSAGVFRASQITTGWFKLAGLSGNAIIRKVQLLCNRATDHNLTVDVGFNDRSTWDQTQTFTRATIAANAVDGEHLEVDVGDECRCRTVRFRVTDATPTGGTLGSGQGPSIYGLVVYFDVDGPDRDLFRRPDGAR